MGNIEHLIAAKGRYGGGIYGEYISNLPHVETVVLIRHSWHNRILKLMEYYGNLYRISRKAGGAVSIRNTDGALFLNSRQKNILVFHHYHPIAKNRLLFWYQKWAYGNLIRNMDQIDILVVVSQYWKDHFEQLDLPIKRIEVIYNPFEVERYAVKGEEVWQEFRKKYGLSDKPIVYIGNLQEEKGALETYEALKNLEIEMVASGIARLNLPVRHLDLSFDDYITLLQLSSVSVLMSRLHEGWNRVAHESLLCGTPVIGTGYGGMGELLEGAGQTICRDFARLPKLVEEQLSNPVIGIEAQRYVSSFSVQRFEKAWEEVLK